MSYRAHVLSACLFLGAGSVGYTNFMLPAAEAQEDAASLDIDTLLELLPEGVKATYDSVRLDESNGTTILTDLRFTNTEDESVGLMIGNLLITDLDMDGLAARLAGTNLADTFLLLDGLEARDISLFGIEKFYGDLGEVSAALAEGLAESLVEDGQDVDIEIEDRGEALEQLAFRIDRISIDDLQLRPFELTKAEDAAEAGDVSVLLSAFQTMAAYQRAIGAKSVSFEGVALDFAMTQDGEPISMSFDMPSIVTEDWRGGDYGKSTTDPMTFSLTAPNYDDDDPEGLPIEQLEISGSIGRQSIEGVRLDEVFSWLTKGEFPPTTETDLMSLGVWRFGPQSFSLFGKEIYTLGQSSLEATGFHWLIPTELTFKQTDLSYNFENLLNVVVEADPELASDSELAEIYKLVEIFKRYDLAVPKVDMDLQWRWDAEAGPANLYMQYGLDGYGTLSFDMTGDTADFAALVAALQAPEEGAAEAFLSATSRFSSFTMEFEDKGGLDKIFPMVIEIAQAMPEDSDYGAIREFTPENLRLLASSGVVAVTAPVAGEFPPVLEYAKSLSAYIQEGGRLTVSAQPENPISVEDFQAMFETLEDPSTLPDVLGVSVIHVAPPGAPTK